MRSHITDTKRVVTAEGVSNLVSTNEGGWHRVEVTLDAQKWDEDRLVEAGLLIRRPACSATKSFVEIGPSGAPKIGADPLVLKCDYAEGHTFKPHHDPATDATWLA